MSKTAGSDQQTERVPRALRVCLGVLVGARLLYHSGYLQTNPFAFGTFSDGQLYEDAARDILRHLPLGREPLYLQGLYAYLLAVGMWLRGAVVGGLLVQLGVAALALWLFFRVATQVFGARAGACSSLVLLAQPALMFYENKYLSVSLGVACNIVLIWAFVRTLERPSFRRFTEVGAAVGLCMLGRPNMLLVAPFAVVALLAAMPARRVPARSVVSAVILGMLLAVAPMAMRNVAVTGRPDVFPSHGGGIPLYIGNNPHANGRWNTAGGLLSGQVFAERAELARRLGLDSDDGRALDARIGRELRARALSYMVSEPGSWLSLELKKLSFMLGNHEFVRDYDALGEAEIMGIRIGAFGLPFGCALGLGALGFAVVSRRRDEPDARGVRRLHGLLWLLAGQLGAVAAANLLIFTSAQNRLPLVVPLSLLAGPALVSLWDAWRLRSTHGLPGKPVLWAAGLLTAQAFIARAPTQTEPSSVHHYNLAVVEQHLGHATKAADSYGRAAQKNPRQPVFGLRYADALRRIGQPQKAAAELDRLQALGPLPPPLAAELNAQRARLRGALPPGR